MAEQTTLLLACPFCAGRAEHAGVAELRWVRCTRCTAEGPSAETDEQAAGRWNTRRAA